LLTTTFFVASEKPRGGRGLFNSPRLIILAKRTNGINERLSLLFLETYRDKDLCGCFEDLTPPKYYRTRRLGGV
jgi:hypothetical protein